ncbi:MAG TPA: CPBP family intramembrane glutamic endopeptidase [Chloroflexota bacterium]|nr:CPBP family intramembrane glutamic endopeptidase [Chloroflexota bacterium]
MSLAQPGSSGALPWKRLPFLLYLVGFFTTWSSIRLALGEQGHTWLAGVVKGLVWAVPVLLYLLLVERRAPLRYLRLATVPSRGDRQPWLYVALLLLNVVGFRLFWGRGLVVALGWEALLVLVLLTAITEEIVFRGFILQQLVVRYAFPTANLLTALLFVLIHVPIWFLTYQLDLAEVARTAPVTFAVSWILGTLFAGTRSLWPPIAVHAVYNLLAA